MYCMNLSIMYCKGATVASSCRLRRPGEFKPRAERPCSLPADYSAVIVPLDLPELSSLPHRPPETTKPLTVGARIRMYFSGAVGKAVNQGEDFDSKTTFSSKRIRAFELSAILSGDFHIQYFGFVRFRLTTKIKVPIMLSVW